MSGLYNFKAHSWLFRSVTLVICVTVTFQPFDLQVDAALVVMSLVQAIDNKNIADSTGESCSQYP